MGKASKNRPSADPTKAKRTTARRAGNLMVKAAKSQNADVLDVKKGRKITFTQEEFEYLTMQLSAYADVKDAKVGVKSVFLTRIAREFYAMFVGEGRRAFFVQVAPAASKSASNDDANPLAAPPPPPTDVVAGSSSSTAAGDSNAAPPANTNAVAGPSNISAPLSLDDVQIVEKKAGSSGKEKVEYVKNDPGYDFMALRTVRWSLCVFQKQRGS